MKVKEVFKVKIFEGFSTEQEQVQKQKQPHPQLYLIASISIR